MQHTTSMAACARHQAADHSGIFVYCLELFCCTASAESHHGAVHLPAPVHMLQEGSRYGVVKL